MYKHTIKALALAVGLSLGGAAMAGPDQSAANDEQPAVWQAYGPGPYYHSRSEIRADYRAALRECRSVFGEARRQCQSNARLHRNDSVAALRDSRYAQLYMYPSEDPIPQGIVR